MSTEVQNESSLQELVAQGACYPLAWLAWHQLRPQKTSRLSAMRSGEQNAASPPPEHDEIPDTAAA